MWFGIAIAVGLIVWAVGGLIALNPLPWHIRKYWDVPGEKELRIIQAIALLLIIAGVTAFFVAEPGSFCHDLWPEMVATGGTVLGIDELNRRRRAQQYKQSIIRQMASLSNDFALDAARIAENEAWLVDGSLAGAVLRGANLAKANLDYANLAGAYLTGANLTGAVLYGANLEGADLVDTKLEAKTLWRAKLAGADLRRANLRGANDLDEAYLERALYDTDTQWPEDFDPKAKGAVNRNELSVEEMEEWRAKYQPNRKRKSSELPRITY